MKDEKGLTLNLTALAVYFILVFLGVPYYYVLPFTLTAQIFGLVLQAKGI